MDRRALSQVLRAAVLLCAVLLPACIPVLTITGCSPPPPTAMFTSPPSPTNTLAAALTATLTPVPTGVPTAEPLAIRVTIQPNPVAQGRLGMLIVEPNRPATVTASLNGESWPLSEENGKWYGLVGVWAATQPASWPVIIGAESADNGQKVTQHGEVCISSHEFELEDIDMPQSVLALVLDSEAVREEMDFIAGLVAPRTPERLWDGAFRQPVASEVSSTYGARRTLNGGAATEQHTGLDLAATEGTPATATNDGRVVFAGPLAVHGNAVIVDHGWGLYSGYCHLSHVSVVQGQSIKRGETIGLVGTTGFSTGPHLHWAMWIGGQPVDPVPLLEWELPR